MALALGSVLWRFLQLPTNKKKGNSLVKTDLKAHKLIRGQQENLCPLQGKDSSVPS